MPGLVEIVWHYLMLETYCIPRYFESSIERRFALSKDFRTIDSK